MFIHPTEGMGIMFRNPDEVMSGKSDIPVWWGSSHDRTRIGKRVRPGREQVKQNQRIVGKSSGGLDSRGSRAENDCILLLRRLPMTVHEARKLLWR